MRIKVPAMVELYPPMMGGGLHGLGQCDPTDPSCFELPTDVFSGGSTDTGIPPPTFMPPVTPVPIDTPTLPGSTITPSYSSGPSLAQILAGTEQAIGTGVNVYRSLQNPGLIPGTNLVYNPATGQILNQAGITAAGVYPIAQTVATSVSSMMPVLLIGGALLLILVMGRH